jgi:hypothetical protein
MKPNKNSIEYQEYLKPTKGNINHEYRYRLRYETRRGYPKDGEQGYI